MNGPPSMMVMRFHTGRLWNRRVSSPGCRVSASAFLASSESCWNMPVREERSLPSLAGGYIPIMVM